MEGRNNPVALAIGFDPIKKVAQESITRIIPVGAIGLGVHFECRFDPSCCQSIVG